MSTASRLGPVALIACATAVSPSASALWNDQLQIFASESLTRDDNVFRVPGNVPPEQVGIPSYSDSFRTTTLGVNLDIPVSAQRFVGTYARRKQRYDRYSNLDVDGRSGELRWLWQVGQRLDGNVFYGEDFFLASFANVQSGVQGTPPNFLEVERAGAEVNFLMTPRWQLSAAVNQEIYKNSQPAFQPSNATIDDLTVGLMFATQAGNRFGVEVEHREGSLPNPQFVGPFRIDNSYSQERVAGVANWELTPASLVTLRAGVVKRSFVDYGARNFDNVFIDSSYEWRPTGKFALTVRGERDVSASEELNVGFVWVNRLTVAPTLAVTEKVSFGISVQQSERDYIGDVGFGFIGDAPAVVERVKSVGASLTYRPTRLVNIDVDFYDGDRGSSLPAGDYDARVATIGVRVTF